MPDGRDYAVSLSHVGDGPMTSDAVTDYLQALQERHGDVRRVYGVYRTTFTVRAPSSYRARLIGRELDEESLEKAGLPGWPVTGITAE